MKIIQCLALFCLGSVVLAEDGPKDGTGGGPKDGTGDGPKDG